MFTDLSYNLGDQPITALVDVRQQRLAVRGDRLRRAGAARRARRSGSTRASAGCRTWRVYGLTVSDRRPGAPAPRRTGAAPTRSSCRRRRWPAAPRRTTEPTAKLKKIKPVKLGKKSKIRGTATDDPAASTKVDAQVRRRQEEELKLGRQTGSSSRSSTATRKPGKYKVRADRRRRRGQAGEGQAQREGQEGTRKGTEP